MHKLLSGASVALAFLFSVAMAQPDTTLQKIQSSKGMLTYEGRKATDLTPRIYKYAFRPQADTIVFDFTLFEKFGKGDFLFLVDRNGVVISSFGNKSGDKFTLVIPDEACLIFKRIEAYCFVSWAIKWRPSGGESKERVRDCSSVKPLCEAQQYSLESQDSVCWLRWETNRRGKLQFLLKPDDASTNLDWELWQGDTAYPFSCPILDSTKAHKVAENYAIGKGAFSETGMHTKGLYLFERETGSPYTQPLAISGKSIFYLKVTAPGTLSSFTFTLSERSVEACKEVKITGKAKEKVRVNFSYKAPPGFIRKYKALAMPLAGEQVNFLFCRKAEEKNGKSLVRHLLEEMKAGNLQGFDPQDRSKNLQYGNLLDALYALSKRTYLDYWNPPETLWKKLEYQVEWGLSLYFDVQSGRTQYEIQSLSLIWNDTGRKMKLLTFDYQDILPILEQLYLNRTENKTKPQEFLRLLHAYYFYPMTRNVSVLRDSPSEAPENYKYFFWSE